MPSPTAKPESDELAAPLYLLLASATPALAGRMMPNANGLPAFDPAPSSYVLEK
jgi:hypothetical protein